MSKTTDTVRAGLQKRYAAEKRFRLYGLAGIVISLGFLLFLLVTIVFRAAPAFKSSELKLDVDLSLEALGLSESPSVEELREVNYAAVVRNAIYERFPGVTKRSDKKRLRSLISGGAEYALRDMVLENPDLVGSTHSFWFSTDDELDSVVKTGTDLRGGDIVYTRLSQKQIAWAAELQDAGELRVGLNKTLFTAGDSREPEQAGIKAALVGSAYTLLVTFLLSFPVAVAAAIYLEEFAPTNRWTDLIEVNINNLAAVPSIVFGLLGLAVFINFFHLPRSAPLVGGIVLSLMTLPTIIISSRAALKAVPPSIRQAAQGLGASEVQVVFHHVLPLAMPGILTGTIIGLAQALGETAPLLMIGMVAFIVDIPTSITDAATVLPVQIFLWADSPERAFTEKTSAAIVILLGFLVVMNAVAVLLRRRFERRW